jgi:crossover junction endodeoxyribonuclease RuvC
MSLKVARDIATISDELACHGRAIPWNILAIDPGLSGAGAVSDERGELIEVFDLPTIGEGAQRRIDAANLADLVREHAPYAFAIVEQVGARPGQGVSSMFRFGKAYGTILGVIGALAIPVRHVSPAKWKKALGLNSDAETSRARAIETWPAQAELFARKRDHNRAEAALLGLYGLKCGGQ